MILPRVRGVAFDLRKISDFCSTKTNIIRADIGEPNLPPPAEIFPLLEKYNTKDSVGYAPTFGEPSLLNALEIFESEKYSYFSEPLSCVTAGAQSGLFAVFASVLKQHDGVVLHNAFYPPYQTIATLLGAEVQTRDLPHLTSLPKNGKLIVLCNPCNPTGEVFSRESLKRIADFARKQDMLILSDDVYDRIAFVPVSHIAEFAPERTISLNSVSKSFALPGLRVGWMTGEASLIQEVAKTHRCLVSCPNTPAQRAVAELLHTADLYLENNRKEYEQRAQKLKKIIDTLGWETPSPQGALYMLPHIPAMTDSEKFVFEMIEQAGVSAVPGKYFGEDNGDRIRLCYGSLRFSDLEKVATQLSSFWNAR